VNKKRDIWVLIGLMIFLVILSAWSVTVGDVSISYRDIQNILKGDIIDNPSWSYIIEGRLNRTIMALLGGGALSVTGLILQVFFKNPLAGPGVLGISSGVTLGVAIVVLGGVSMLGLGANLSLVSSGLFGALVILSVLMLISKYIKHSVTLLIVGLMLSYFASALVSALYHWADLEQSRQFIVWGLGSFNGVSTENIQWILPLILFSMVSLISIIRPLNALVLGEDYAKSLGVNIKKTKVVIILISSLLTAVITVYCGPVAFVGIAVPQIVRGLTKSKSHQIVLPIAVIFGALFALLADLVIRLTGNVLPLNTVTSLIGAPIIVWTIINMNRRG
jgi:iron complex transport system permease protein